MVLHPLSSPRVPIPTPAAVGLVGQGDGCLGVCQGDAVWGAATLTPGTAVPTAASRAGGRLPTSPQASHSYVPELGMALMFHLEENSHL